MGKYDNIIDLANNYELLACANREYGPYTMQNGRQIMIIKDDKGNSRTVSYPKHIMEKHLGRVLDPNLETIQHLDGNHNNNDINNLKLMPRDEHSATDTRRVKNLKFNCDTCGKEFERSPRLVRDKSKKGVTGIFCSRQCAGSYSRKIQLGLIDKLPVQPYIESEYYNNRDVKACAEYLIQKYAI